MQALMEKMMGSKWGKASGNEVRQSGLLNSPGILRKYIAAMPEESVAEFQSIQASTSTLEILQDVPEVEDRLAIVRRLREVTDPKYIRHYLTQ